VEDVSEIVINYLGEKIFIAPEYLQKVSQKDTPITLEEIQETLKDPDFVTQSWQCDRSHEYYKIRSENIVRFTKAVVKKVNSSESKTKVDELWLSTAHKSTKPNLSKMFIFEKDENENLL
jgi:hypothetical protein